MLKKYLRTILSFVAVLAILATFAFGTGNAHAQTLSGEKHIKVSYVHHYSGAWVPACIQLPHASRSEYGGWEIKDVGNVTGNATDTLSVWGYDVITSNGIYEGAWDRDGNPMPFHIDGQMHFYTCD